VGWDFGTGMGGGDVLSIAVMGAVQGCFMALGAVLRSLSLETDCRRMGVMAVEPPLGGMVVVREGRWRGLVWAADYAEVSSMGVQAGGGRLDTSS
jgi:hypothetical protein